MRNSFYTLLAIAFGLALAAGHDNVKAQASAQTSCDEIAVLGAVKQPGRFKFTRSIRLLEVLAHSGGPTERAGKTVRVVRTCACTPCPNKGTKSGESSDYELAAVLQGTKGANPELAPGDIVIIRETELVFVYVNGFRSQRSVVYREGLRLTRVLDAIGIDMTGDLLNVKIYHPRTAEQKYSFDIVNLRAIREGRIEDPLLRPRDILEFSDGQGRFPLLAPPFRFNPPILDPPLFPRNSPNC